MRGKFANAELHIPLRIIFRKSGMGFLRRGGGMRQLRGISLSRRWREGGRGGGGGGGRGG